MLLYMMAAFDARMNLAELLNANSASLAYLKLLESMPVGTDGTSGGRDQGDLGGEFDDRCLHHSRGCDCQH